jgi:DNA-binding PadR family transcriptional regulator
MEKKNNQSTKKEDEETEKGKAYIEKKAENKKQPVAKDLVSLKHVEVKKQKISPETRDLAQTLKESYLEHDQFERLTNDEITILETFMGRRLFLERIAIIANQSRIPLGIPGFKRVELEEILANLVSKGYLESETVGNKKVYFLTERGRYRVQ